MLISSKSGFHKDITETESPLFASHQSNFFRRRLMLILPLGIAILLRVGFVLSLEEKIYFGDANDYLVCAKNVLAGQGFNVMPNRNAHAHVPPFYPLFLLISMIPFGDSLLAIRILQAFIGASLVLPAFLLMKKMGHPTSGIWAAWIVAVYPYYIYWTGMVATETLCIFILAWTYFFFFQAARKNHYYWWALCGFSLGLASLTRSSCLGLMVVFLGAIVLWNDWGWRTKLKSGAWFFLAFTLTMAPYTVRNYFLFGHMVPVTLGNHMLYYQALKTTNLTEEERSARVSEMFGKYFKNPTSPEDEYLGHQVLKKEAWKIIRQHPTALIPIWQRNFLRFWSFYPTQFSENPNRNFKILGLLSYGLLFPFFLAGMFYGVLHFRKFFLLFGSLAYFTLVHSVFMALLRYRLPVEIILIAFGSISISILWNHLLKIGKRPNHAI